MHLHHLNCVLLDTGSGCASPLSIDGVAFGISTRLTSRFLTVQVGQTVLDRYMRSESSFSVGDLQYPPAGQHLLSLTVRIPPFPWEAPPSAKTTINPRLLFLPICHSMQCTPRTPLTTPSPTTLMTPQRTPSPAPRQKSPATTPLVQTPYQSHHVMVTTTLRLT